MVGGYNSFQIVNGAHIRRPREGYHQKATGKLCGIPQLLNITMLGCYDTKALKQDESIIISGYVSVLQSDWKCGIFYFYFYPIL